MIFVPEGAATVEASEAAQEASRAATANDPEGGRHTLHRFMACE